MQEYSAQRRVKPLPKRRRTSDIDTAELAIAYADSVVAAAVDASSGVLPHQQHHLDLASYYQFSSTPQTNTVESVTDGGVDHSNSVTGQNDSSASTTTTAYRTFGSNNEEDDEPVDGDYVDHLQQPGTTKKRKVPAAHAGMLLHPHTDGSSGIRGSTMDGSTTQQTDEPIQGFAGGLLGGTAVLPSIPTSYPPNSAPHPRKFRASPATITGLKRKEVLKSRKRQVLGIVNALPNAENLALDQALASHLAWYRPTSGIHIRHKPTCRRHRRSSSANSSPQRLIRGASPSPQSAKSVSPPWDERTFTFDCPSVTTERLVATRAEVANLVEKFHGELERQAAAAAQAARQAAANNEAMMKSNSNKSSQNSDGSRNRPANTTVPDAPGGDSAGAVPAKSGRSKKKKRSALANASNPHHLRNYVPSRLPNSGPPPTISAAQAALTFLGPPPVRFLTADIMPRGGRGGNNNPVSRKRFTTTATAAVSAMNGDGEVVMPDEWICSFCEYDLFYGTEASFRHGVRARKKILRRRRRARERAARAASGVVTAPAAPSSSQMDDAETEDEGEYEDPPYENTQSSGPRVIGGGSREMLAGSTGGDNGAG